MNRRHDIDALRVFAFGLLILYHVGMFYVADWGWHVKSAYQSSWLQLPMLLTNQWRMALIFLISGLAVNFVWGKYSAARFAARRFVRLFIPLVFGMAFIIAPQAYYEALSKGIIEPGFWHFMGQYLSMQDFPAEAWGGAEMITWTWTHLWYLPYLLAYTLVLIPIAKLLDGPAAPVRAGFRRLRGLWLILVPLAPLMLAGTFVFPRYPFINHALFGDWYAHSMFFTFFLIGFLLGRDDGLWKELARLRRPVLALAIASFILFRLQAEILPVDRSVSQNTAGMFITYLNRWLWIVAILGWGHHLLNRPFRWLPYATEAVYPWYILHQTLTITAGYQLAKLQLGPVVEPALVLLATIGGCMLIHEFVIRRTPLLRPLFGLTFRAANPASRRAVPSAA